MHYFCKVFGILIYYNVLRVLINIKYINYEYTNRTLLTQPTYNYFDANFQAWHRFQIHKTMY